ncbi:MAG: septum formation initiator family protein [Gemmatimonadaceae bacterium]
MSSKRKLLLRRAVMGALAVVVIVFAVEGGEYGTYALLNQKVKRQRLISAIDSLKAEIDSLEAVKRAVLTDPATQERIAREQFGMVRDGEILYRFAEPADSVPQP